jgi:hypothetical protein
MRLRPLVLGRRKVPGEYVFYFISQKGEKTRIVIFVMFIQHFIANLVADLWRLIIICMLKYLLVLNWPEGGHLLFIRGNFVAFWRFAWEDIAAGRGRLPMHHRQRLIVASRGVVTRGRVLGCTRRYMPQRRYHHPFSLLHMWVFTMLAYACGSVLSPPQFAKIPKV